MPEEAAPMETAISKEIPIRSKPKPFPFLSLPGELRELIYYGLLSPVENREDGPDYQKVYKFDLRILRVNQQIYFEARKILRKTNVFIRIATPWPEAKEHVRNQGFVPMIASDEKARTFSNCHLDVVIDPPSHRVEDQELTRFIILLDDLKRFCDMWFYSDLGFPGLNRHLRLTLTIRDPYSLPFDQQLVPKALQRQLLKPFGRVKDLSEVVVKGEHYESVEKAMKDEMAAPSMSAKDCLEEATRLKLEGNTALQHKRYREAISFYEQSFLAIHIVCEGRRRSVWADAYFQTEIREGTYKGQYGHIARLVLRAQLVANVVLAYLSLKEYEEAKFWGERTIHIMREATGGNDEPMVDFVAAKEVGKIYWRTGRACKALQDYMHAEMYLKAASSYLRHDKVRIQEEINECHPPKRDFI